jgi:hypothetical protein
MPASASAAIKPAYDQPPAARRIESSTGGSVCLDSDQGRLSLWLGLRVAGRLALAGSVVGLLVVMLTGTIGGKP